MWGIKFTQDLELFDQKRIFVNNNLILILFIKYLFTSITKELFLIGVLIVGVVIKHVYILKGKILTKNHFILCVCIYIYIYIYICIFIYIYKIL